jgi:hypothetical protein
VQNLLASIFVFFKATRPSILRSNLNNSPGVNSNGELIVLFRNESVNVFVDPDQYDLIISSFDTPPLSNDEANYYSVDQLTGDLIFDQP